MEEKLMIYALSDLHGCFSLYKEMLEKIDFSDNDTLYVLGDCVDRGEEPISILQDMKKHKNIIPLFGNHELRFLNIIAQGFMDCSKEQIVKLSSINSNVKAWLLDGGVNTYLQYNKLTDEEKKDLVAYVKRFEFAQLLNVNGRTFSLSHSIPSKERFLQPNTLGNIDFIYGDPSFDQVYKEGTYFVYGHTPTVLIDEKYAKKIYNNNGHIDLDCGAVFIGTLGCLCLDTLEEFYVEKQNN